MCGFNEAYLSAGLLKPKKDKPAVDVSTAGEVKAPAVATGSTGVSSVSSGAPVGLHV